MACCGRRCCQCIFVWLGSGTTVLSLTASHPSLSSVAPPTSKPMSQPLAVPAAVKPQPITAQGFGSAPQPAAFQSQPFGAFHSQEIRPSAVQPMLPSSQPPFGNQAFSFTKQKDPVSLSKQPQPSPAVLSTKTIPPGSSLGLLATESAHSQSLAGSSSLTSQSFNFGLPLGHSTPAPSTNKPASQLRFDTATGSTSASVAARTVTVTTVPVTTVAVAITSATTAVSRTVAGNFTLPLSTCF